MASGCFCQSPEAWAAIPPRDAGRIALVTAAVLDQRLESFPTALLEQIHSLNPRWVIRALHRDQHLDEAVAALKH
ncbi:MAG: hypothetical protein PHQ40_19855 [Anaerolineaceae bacterium]|nr:hypothetical protein [Anaerolineaceae bacterium]